MGGGPSGSTTAALVAEAGFRVLLLERDAEPRRKVGESLMPETYWVFERLGVLDGMKNGPFVEKVGVQFVSSSGKESSPFLFTRHDPRGAAARGTWSGRSSTSSCSITQRRRASKFIAASACWKSCSKASAPSACESPAMPLQRPGKTAN